MNQHRLFAAAVALLAVLSVIPFVGVTYPAMSDYPNHLARLYMVTGYGLHDWGQYYAVRDVLIPNLGLEMFAGPAVKYLGQTPEAAYLGATLLSAILFATGVIAMAMSRGGGLPWLALLAFPLAFNRYFVWGFFSYMMSLALAFWAVAFFSWAVQRRLTGKPYWCAAFLGAVAGAVILLTHLMGFGVLVLVVAALSMSPSFRGQNTRTGIVVLAGSFVLPAALLYLLAFEHSRRSSVIYGDFAEILSSKVSGLLSPFFLYRFDAMGGQLLILGAVVGVLIWTWRRQMGHFDGPVMAVVLTLLVAFLLLPQGMLGSGLLDRRLFIVFLCFALLSIRPVLMGRALAVVLFGTFIATAARVVELTWAWRLNDQVVKTMRQQLGQLPVGATVLTVSFRESDRMEFPPIHHVPSLAAVDRGALVPGVFAHPYTGQSIAVRDKAAVDRLAWFSSRRTSGDTAGLNQLCSVDAYVVVTFERVLPELPRCFVKLSGAADFGIYRIN